MCVGRLSSPTLFPPSIFQPNLVAMIARSRRSRSARPSSSSLVKGP